MFLAFGCENGCQGVKQKDRIAQLEADARRWHYWATEYTSEQALSPTAGMMRAETKEQLDIAVDEAIAKAS